jgi:predicted nucleic acid-binding protein
MGLTLSGKERLFFDTAPFIYIFEKNEPYEAVLRTVFSCPMVRGCRWSTSVITLIEVLTLPRRNHLARLEDAYRRFLTDSQRIELKVADAEVCEKAVYFRAEYGFKTPDAIQLATAQVFGADIVVTNDQAWKKIKELHVVTLDEL